MCARLDARLIVSTARTMNNSCWLDVVDTCGDEEESRSSSRTEPGPFFLHSRQPRTKLVVRIKTEENRRRKNRKANKRSENCAVDDGFDLCLHQAAFCALIRLNRRRDSRDQKSKLPCDLETSPFGRKLICATFHFLQSTGPDKWLPFWGPLSSN